MELNCGADTLSVSLESCGPFSVTDPEHLNNMDEPGISQIDALVEPFNSIVRCESLELRDNDGKYISRFIDAQRKAPGNLCSIKRRSTRNSSSNRKTDNKLAARKGSRTSGKKPKQDLLPMNVGRRRRSGLARRVRASIWGLGGNINEVFEQNAEKNANEIGCIESRKGRTGGRGGKRNTDVVSRGIQSSKGESQASERGLIVKLKLGKKVTQNCQLNRIPVMDDGLEWYREVKIEASNLTSDRKVNSEEQVPNASTSQSCIGDMDNGVLPSEDAVIGVLSDKDRSGNLYDRGGNDISDTIGVRETVENRCLDAGTSPDSEVIDVIPETQTSGVAGGLHDIQISSKDRGACQAGDGVESGLPSPEIINDVLSCDKYEQNEKSIDGPCSGFASISTTTGFASSNSSNRGGCLMEPIASLQETEVGVSKEPLTIGRGRQTDLSVDAGLESVVSEKLFPVAKSKIQKLQKSSRSKGMSKGMTDVPASLNKKQTNCQQKGSQPKSSGKGKMENGNDQAIREMEGHPRTGNCVTDDIGELKEHCRSTAKSLSNSTMVHNEGKNQHGLPRNAWVCCDDCHKWRRIPAILADSIESKDSRWVCMDNMDKVFADCSIPQEKSNSDINEELEISDEEDAYKSHLDFTPVEQKQSIDPPLSSWKLIRTNLFLHRNRKNQTIDEIMVCHCKPPLDGRRGCRDGCLNRMLNIECAKGTCPCGELCSNQQFQKRKHAKLKCFRCGKKGYGLQLQEDIPKGRFLIEYVGEVLDMTAYEARQREYASKGHKHFYFMTLNGSEVIDACAKGNLGRFINHSCEPNCRTEKWMVNGEVCIGLFAIRDIKKGEELTFDYNYVRVFGAAAKKCVCGSSRCRGYIGGDPQNAETVVLGDSDEEYPEPVMYYGNGRDKLDNVLDGISSSGMQSAENTCENNGGEMDKRTTAAGHLETMGNEHMPDSLLVSDDEIDNSTFPIDCAEKEVSFKRSPSASSVSESKIEDRLLPSAVQPLDASMQLNDKKSENTLDHSVAEEDVNRYLFPGARTKISPTSSVNLLPDTFDTQRKPKSHADDSKSIIGKPHSHTKITRVSAVVKRGKPKRNVNISKPPEIENKSLVVHHDTKKLVDDALNGRFEAVQEALNVLLNDKGGISRRRDASKGYLKLLILTAASGEGIQSTRDLSMILDALLKTNSRTVLLDIINKNGLQMLHNIMKRYRWEFNKIPILRKLLKVIEHLADLKMLTLENILKPSRLGAESFKESMLLLTEHADKQVHQFARSFRDKWIPWSERKINWVDRDATSNFHRLTTPHNYSSDRDKKPSEVADTPSTHTPPVDAKPTEGIPPSCITDGTRRRKRKSRWDQPGDLSSGMGSPPKKEQKSINGGTEEVKGTSHDMHEEKQNTDDDADAPPGFSSPINRHSLPSKPVMGYPQERYNSQLPTSFGVPSSVFQKLGLPKGAPTDSWVISPAVTFLPFPPLPVCPRRNNSVGVHMEKDHPNQFTPNFQTFRNNSNRLGRRYFRQQKWNDPRPDLPWNPNKNGYGGFVGAGYGGNEANGTYNNNTGFVSANNNESYGNRFYQQQPHQ